MKIINATNSNNKLIQDFVSPYEAYCVQLCSYIRKNSPSIYILSENENPTEVSHIFGVIFISSTILHCIPKNNLPLINKPELSAFLLSKNLSIKCISGESQATEFIYSSFTNVPKPYQINNYNLMTTNNIISCPENLFNDDEIKRCTENDLETLLPLQKQYILEEVAPTGKELSDLEVSMNLRQILKNQLCLALFSDGEPVAKANTNAIGINWVQLGGVYTLPLYRRNNYAWQLISAICRKTAASGKSTSLFVKNINVPAIELYKKLGFTKIGEYQIIYIQ